MADLSCIAATPRVKISSSSFAVVDLPIGNGGALQPLGRVFECAQSCYDLRVQTADDRAHLRYCSTSSGAKD